MQIMPLEVYATDSNYAIIKTPGRKFPGSVIPLKSESRPDGAWDSGIASDPGLNALGYRISPRSGLEGDFVA